MPPASQPGFVTAERVPREHFGRYAAIAALGTGGMADVYLAVARGLEGFNKLAVVKRLRASSEADQIRMFLDEARLAARLAHPNIVHTYEVGESEGSYFIAMEYLEGQSLEKVVRRYHACNEALPEAVAVHVMILLLKALHYMHELRDYDGTPLDCVHRDVSPHNVFVTYGGEVKLLDFGIAKAALNTSVTESGELKGKIRYMSPEQVAGEPMDRRADVYGAGIVFWELLARRGLYEGDAMAVMARIVNSEPPRVSSVRSCDPLLDDIVARALRKDRAGRYPTADAMRLELEAYLHERAPSFDVGELSSAMTRLFAESQADAHAQVQAFLAAAARADSTNPTGSMPRLAIDESSGKRPRPIHEMRGTVPKRPASRVPAVIVAGLTLLGALGAAWVALRPEPPRPAPTSAPTLTYQAHLFSNPPGARIEWNGKLLGETPATVTLPLGTQTIVLIEGGFEPASVIVESADAAVVERTVDLRSRAPAPSAERVAPSAAPVTPASPLPMPRPRGTSNIKPTPSAAASVKPLHIRVVDDGENP